MAKILFFSIGSHIPEGEFYATLGAQLIDLGHEITIVTLARSEYRGLQGRGMQVIWMRDELHRVERAVRPRMQAEQERIRTEYSLSLRDLWQSDVSSRFTPPARMEEKTVAYFVAWEQLIDRLRPDVLLGDFGGELLRRVAKRVADRKGVTYLYFDWSPIRGHMAIHTNEYNHWDHLVVEDKPLAPEQQAEVDAYLQETHAGQLSAASFWTPGINSTRMRRLVRELWREWVTERGLHDHFTPTRWFGRFCQRLLKRPFLDRLYSAPVPGEKYIFFPLHFADDAQLTVRAPAFLRQEYLVDWVARSLPDGFKLYMKEHPGFIAKYPLETYRKIVSLPDVRLLSPYLKPNEVIANATAIVTINSTAGFEALLQHKPVVVCGPVSYRGYGATIDVDDICQLPQKIREAVVSPPPAWKIDRFLWHMIHASFPGRLYNNDPLNLRKVVLSIHSRVLGIAHPDDSEVLAELVGR